MEIRQIWLDEVPSTNSWLKERCGDLSMPVAVACRRQSAGRGQRGNSWESEPGKNITLSLLFAPPETLKVSEQFRISEAVALAVVDFLAGRGVAANVKWPNDIYVGERKICGILIENSLLGSRLISSVAGIGLNLNQREFLSDAPNPVSLLQLTGTEANVEESVEELLALLWQRLSQLSTPESRQTLHDHYLSNLWRAESLSGASSEVPSPSSSASSETSSLPSSPTLSETSSLPSFPALSATPSPSFSALSATPSSSSGANGSPFHPFRDCRTGERFRAKVADVAPDGLLTLLGEDGLQRQYLFKEVSWLPETPGLRFAAEPAP